MKKRNAPITSAQATVLQQILASHGWTKSNPAKYAKRKSTWKKRFGSKTAMLKHMAKMRRKAKKSRK